MTKEEYNRLVTLCHDKANQVKAEADKNKDNTLLYATKMGAAFALLEMADIFMTMREE